jgi:hypothetical protein
MPNAPAEDQTRSEILDKIRKYFEGKEAIYIEKGALRVRVSNIRQTNFDDYIEADIEEIPTSGLPVSLPGYDRRNQPRPLRWKIGTNIKVHPHFFPHYWTSAPYVGWSMRFSPKLIEGIVELASGFPPEQLSYYGYHQVQSYIDDQLRKSFRTSVKRAQFLE